ncbi:MAG: NAD(P)-dependent oxidoreductase [Deltaproteobacteria bacterium]|nr:NAD(P)-dependent oxidoreductase [Deltaproteobacteria bacterium]MBW1929220.1 NAD(P)-dependent oxidoreductase [Deltaproteobacteria bacterium]MBW2025241.1 NAD(P)-dependent oxidoreductase [Deltaproteobacteria bacterium]
MARSKKIIVTGGSGYLGTVLVHKLLANNYRVTVVDTEPFVGRGRFEDKALEVIRGNFSDEHILNQCLPETFAVIHLAGISDGRQGRKQPGFTREINFKASKILVDAAKAAGVQQFLFASTFGVYGNNHNELLRENLPVCPAEPYSQSKADLENYLSGQAHETFCPVTLRLAMIYGLSPKMRYDLIVNQMIREAVEKGELFVWGGDQKRPQIHIQDAANYFTRLLEVPPQEINGEVFNAGNDNIAIRDLAFIIAENVHRPVKIRFQPARKNENSFELDSSKIRERLGFVPQFHIKDAVVEIEQNLLINNQNSGLVE